MGVDLFVGTWPRYLTGNWETPIQKFARESGIKVNRVGPPPRWVSGVEARKRITAFRENIGEKLGPIAPFGESEDAEYSSYQLMRESVSALVLCAAHASRPDLTLPRRLPPDVQNTPAVSEASAQKYYIGPMAVFEAHIFIVGSEARLCGALNPFGDQVIVVTTAALKDSIDSLGAFLKVSPDEIEEAKQPSAGPIMHVEKGKVTPAGHIQPLDEVRDYALWGLSCFSKALEKAEARSLSIIRDE